MSERDTLLEKGSRGSKVKYYHNQNVGWATRRCRAKEVKQYYNDLDALHDLYEKDRILMEGGTIPEEVERAPDRILARISLILNVALLFLNLSAAYLSGSLSIMSTFVDSLMDISTSLILGICLWLINNTNGQRYPRGRNRLELLGVMLCCIIMGIANMAIIMQSVAVIVSGDIHPEVDILILGIMLGGSGVKIILMIVCYKRGTSSSVVLAMDMRNDIATSLVAVACATIGDRIWPYADPVGAIAVCSLIAISWFYHAVQYVPVLVGVAAERQLLSRILKITIEHDPRIKFIDHVMVYHTGVNALVELHIVMDQDLPLKITHDISHPLEKKLMKLDFVERAFVHCDYDCDGD